MANNEYCNLYQERKITFKVPFVNHREDAPPKEEKEREVKEND
jgi:hypothetical protein